MTKCPNCGTENRPNARFCRMCGQILEVSSDGQHASAPVPADATITPAAAMETNPVSVAAQSREESAPPAEVEAQEPVLPLAAQLPTTREEESPALSPAEHRLAEAQPVASSAEGIASLPTEPSQLPQPELVSEPAVPSLAPLVPVGWSTLDVGSVLQGRFHITGCAAQEKDAVVYVAEDWRRCWSCQAEQVEAGLRFCEACGAELSQHPSCRIRETRPTEQPKELEAATEFWEGDRLYHLLQAAPLAPATPKGVRLIVGYLTDAGKVRDLDEDSVLAIQLVTVCEARSAPVVTFVAVADGIGGHAAGEVASRMAMQVLSGALFQHIFLPLSVGEVLQPESLESNLVAAVREANAAILAVRQKNQSDMGSTLTAMLAVQEQAFIVNVGDSRTYLMRNGKLQLQTRDHSLVASLIASGMAQPAEIYTHEKKNVIYRSLGDKPDLPVDVFPVTLQPGDRLLLCCDGLWEMVRDQFIEDVLLEQPDSQAACQKLVEMANWAGGEDNISVIVVNVDTFSQARQPQSTQ